ncbi:aminopeptidase N [Homoserinibacter sp. GY 40078]|uniref:aminopeptidase N n=1 Tax=Homoserinibacter sp. GY 40078 TaxID=2603275 RepID=UPI0011C85969|nr:aminopeptidase N [Homoserinibacter sp. GY 40078]TXK19663.1 aminopeptidase N [Homoserinibacter sp. GY 40078]
MPGENLTRVEAQERKALLEVESYDVTLDLTTGEATFRSTTTVRFTATPGSSTFIDAFTRGVHSIVLNGVELPADAADGARIRLDDLAEANELVVDADFAYTNTGEGLHRFVDPVDDEVYLYTQFEVPDSRRVFAVFEQPDLKATFAFTITAPEAWQVISNSPTPEPEPAGDGIATWRFAPTPRISSYITALVAGPYEVVRSELTSSDGRTIPLGIFARRSLFGYLDADYIFDTTRKGFAYYEEKFGYPYPFEKYDQLFVPEFNAGAMENAGAVTFTETYVFRSKVTDAIKERRVVTILHELAHMWFGDLVTMKWWNDLWLNESFAEWASTIATAEATEWTHAWATFQAMEKSWAYRQDQLPSTHPVVADIRDLEDVQVNFDGITYAKGGSVLKQLAAWVGIDAFFAGVGAYFRAHEYGNTELADLLRELETSSGRDLSTFSSQWLETAGVATLAPQIETEASGTITSFRIRQTAPADYPTIRQHRIAVGFYSFPSAAADAPLIRVHRHEFDLAAEEWNEIPELVGMPKPDLVLLNDDDLAYAKIRLDEASFAVAVEALSRIEEPLARALVWGAAWDMTRDAEIPARDYVRLVLGNIGPESESTTMRLALTQLVQAARWYVDPAAREQTIREVGDGLWALAQQADAGSDAQFQFVKFFANAASTTEHAAALQGLRDGSIALDGLEIDTDLDWELLEGLVLVGAAGELEIAATLEKDDTANGRQAAARARATIATAEGKAAALTAALTDTSIPNVVLRNMGMGFTHVNDPSALEPLVAEYFDALTHVWEERNFAIAQYIVHGFYPSPLVSTELVDASRAWLDSHTEVPALRRMVIEELAGVERALAAQERDRQG